MVNRTFASLFLLVVSVCDRTGIAPVNVFGFNKTFATEGLFSDQNLRCASVVTLATS